MTADCNVIKIWKKEHAACSHHGPMAEDYSGEIPDFSNIDMACHWENLPYLANHRFYNQRKIYLTLTFQPLNREVI